MAEQPNWFTMFGVNAAAHQQRVEPALRCSHCGRAVRETRHTREAWCVDYYLLRGGNAEPATIVSEREGTSFSYMKLISHFDVITCRDCYGRPEIQRQRQERFRPEQWNEASE